MVIKREVAYGIVRGLSEFWKSEEFQDFTVTLGSTHFGCHRFLLAACSGFFRGLFRSGMKESESKSATLEDISSETFQLVLEVIYTGRGVLTSDNVIDIWRAANQLQITFLIQECEHFVIKSLSIDNYVQYFYNARLLNSKIVTDIAWSFILKNSVHFFKTSCFLDLPFCDVLSLVKNQDLVIKSEDDVINAIFKWTEVSLSHLLPKSLVLTGDVDANGDTFEDQNIKDNKEDNKEDNKDLKKNLEGVNEPTPESKKDDFKIDSGFERPDENSPEKFSKDRRRQFIILLSSARTCLASHGCLEISLNHFLVQDNKCAREIIIKALLYQLQAGKRNGQWPSGAVHRNNSDYENVAIAPVVSGSNVTVSVFSFSRNAWLKFPSLNFDSTINFAAVDNVLYALGYSINLNTGVHYEGDLKQSTSGAFQFKGACTNKKYYDNEKLEADDFSSSHKPLAVFQLKKGIWSKLDISLTLQSTGFDVTVVDSCIYILSSNGQEVLRFNSVSVNHNKMRNLPSNQSICHVTSYDKMILVFYSLSTEGVDETAVHCFDTSLNTWTQLNNLEGPANGMTSFKDDQSTYILQANGDLWKLLKTQSDVLDFEFVVKLWSCEWSLHGAVTFNDVLYIYGIKSDVRKDDPRLRKCLPGVFKEIIYMESNSVEKSSFLPFIADKKFFV